MQRTLAAAACAVLVAFAGGCGGDDRAEDVDAYLVQVARAQRGLAIHVGELNRSYREFASGGKLAELTPRFQRAERELAEQRDRIDAIQHPPDAQRLRRLLLGFTDSQLALAHEVTLFGRYQPRIDREFAVFRRAERALRRGLERAKTPAEQAEAFVGYRRAIRSGRMAIVALNPPPVLTSSRDAQLRRLERIERIVGTIVTALRKDDREALELLLKRYGKLIAEADTAADRRARANAIRGYNARIVRSNRLASEIRIELTRLERELAD